MAGLLALVAVYELHIFRPCVWNVCCLQRVLEKILCKFLLWRVKWEWTLLLNLKLKKFWAVDHLCVCTCKVKLEIWTSYIYSKLWVFWLCSRVWTERVTWLLFFSTVSRIDGTSFSEQLLVFISHLSDLGQFLFIRNWPNIKYVPFKL